MTALKIILITVGAALLIFGYLIYFKERYDLINDFEADYKAGRKTADYAKKVGKIELVSGCVFVLIGICIIVFK